MAILTSITQRLYHYCSYGIVTNLFTWDMSNEWKLQPFCQLIMIILSLFTIYYLYTQQKLESEREAQLPQVKDNKLVVYENLTWFNQILRWISLSHRHERPLALQTWLDGINVALEKQKTEITTYVYGFREGTVAPWVRKIEQVQTDQHGSLRMQATLESGCESGFVIDVEERVHNKLQQSTYTLVINKFICKFDICLNRHDNNDVEIEMRASDKKPSISMKMKPHVLQRQIQSTVPEVISNAVIDAVLATPFIYIFDANEYLRSTGDFYDVREEDSNTEASEEEQLAEREDHASPNLRDADVGDADVHDVGDSSCDVGDISCDDDVTSILLVQVVAIEKPPTSSTIVKFSFQIDSPLQRKNLCDDCETYKFERNKMTSQLKVGAVFHITPSDSQRSAGVEQTLSIDEVDVDLMKFSPLDVTVVTLQGKDDDGSIISARIQLKISQQQRGGTKDETTSNKKSSTSLSTAPSGHDVSPVTKVTSSSHTSLSSPTRMTSSVRRSGNGMVTSQPSEAAEDIRYMMKSVAESVLTHLHDDETTRTAGGAGGEHTTKSRIIVCAQQQQNDEKEEGPKAEEDEQSQKDSLSIPNSYEQDDKKTDQQQQQQQEIRRTQSLRMSKQEQATRDMPRATSHHHGYHDDDEFVSHGTARSSSTYALDNKKKKKTSTIKRVFSMRRKKKKGDDVTLDDDADDVSEVSPTKSMGSIKRKNRASSFRNLLHLGKKK